ncbi:MAG: PEP-CTERM sorting domain-containing protein [Planctomycetia bacterium]|nr:PEP-CTERM sorting domain-containing protein [Planctomycetia bacterium]
MNRLLCSIGVVVVLSAACVANAVLPSDNFNDNSMDTSLWTLFEDDSDHVWLDETNGRLELRSSDADDEDAFYIGNNWGFDPSSDFSFKVDYYYASTTNAGGVMLGVAKDHDNNFVAEASYEDGAKSYYYEIVTGGFDAGDDGTARTADDGTLYISYDRSENELYLSVTDYWSTGSPIVTILNLLEFDWGDPDMVTPMIGGWAADSLDLASGEAYLDNFVVDSGAIVPEPLTVAFLGLGLAAVRVLRRRKL